MNQISASSKTVGIFRNSANKKLIELFNSQNKKVFAFPALETRRAGLSETEHDLLKNIFDFDWIVFSDFFTVEFFLEILEAQNIDFYDLDRLKICSIGEAVADSLRFRQVHSDVIPPKNTVEASFTALSDYIFAEDKLSGLRFLILKSTAQNSELANLLAENFAEVREVEIYEIVNQNESEITKLKALLVGGAIDEFVFSSPEEVFSLFKLIGAESFAQTLSDLKIRALNEITLQTLSEFKVNAEI